MDLNSQQVAYVVDKGTRLASPKTCSCGYKVLFIESDACICKEGRLWLECPSCWSTMTVSNPEPFAS